MPEAPPLVQASPIIQQLPPPEERRVVTVMFADITGSTPLADRLDPEDMRAILTGYFNLMAEQIRKHDGTIEKYIGDAVMAVFGTPIAHEDDPDRAIRAALDMQAALANFNEQRLATTSEATRLQMRIGINTGEVAAPGSALQQRQDFLITGDAVNIAARLQQIAAPDTILVGERTYQSAREVFTFREIAPLQLRGKPDPIVAYTVTGLRSKQPIITQPPRGVDGRQAALVGRALELTLLHTSYARVQAERRPHLITLLGVPGVGKSRLVREFITREQNRDQSAPSQSGNVAPLVLKGRCPPYGEGVTYWPLIEILRSLLNAQENETNEDLRRRFKLFVKETLEQARRTETADEIADALLQRIGRSLGGKEIEPDRHGSERQPVVAGTVRPNQNNTQATLLRAWRVLLEALGERQPLIIVIDDLQWADDALLELLEYLTDRIAATPVLFLCPARPDFLEHRRDWGGGHRNFTAIELEALTWEESSELVDELLNSSDLPDAVRSTILARAEGNPFFVEELIRMLIDRNILVHDRDQGHGTAHWRIGTHNDALYSELSTPGELPDDALIERHYLLPLAHLPDTIQGVLAARVDLLHPLERIILQHAAIVGRTFWFSALQELTAPIDVESLFQALRSLIRRDFITERDQQVSSPEEGDRTFSFKHILIRDVVYNNIPRQRRSREHAQLAVWLEATTAHKRETFIELLAYHYQQAFTNWSTNLAIDTIELENPDGAGQPPVRLTRSDLRARTILYLTRTGDQAMHGYYTLHAIRSYNDAFELLQDSQADALTLSKMLVKLGDAYAQRSSLDEAWQHYRRALRLITETGMTEDGAYLLVLYERLSLLATRWLSDFENPPDMQEIRDYINAGLDLLKGQPTSQELIAFLTYQALWYIRQLENVTGEQKAELVEQAIASGHEALCRAEELGNARTLSLVLDAMGFVYERHHQYHEALELQQRRQTLENLLTDREELHDLYISLGRTYYDVGDYAAALMWFGRAWNTAQTMESPTMQLNSLAWRMRTWNQWNRWDEASQVAQEVLQFIEKYQQDEKQQFRALETLAAIAYQRGDLETADQYSRQCKRLLDQHLETTPPERQELMSTRMYTIHLAQEDWERAANDYSVRLRYSEPFPAPDLLAALAELSLQTSATDETRETLCERAIATSRQSGARKQAAQALRARGRMYLQRGRWDEAEADLRLALQEYTGLDLPLEQGITRYWLGMLYKRRAGGLDANDSNRNSDLERARHHFEQSLGFYESLGARPAVLRVREELRQEASISQ